MDYKWQIFIDNSFHCKKYISNEEKSTSVCNGQLPDLIMQTATKLNKKRGSLKRQVKRSYSQNIAISYSKQVRCHRKRKKFVRKAKVLNVVPISETMSWNWQLETGAWSEVNVNVPLEIERKKINATEQRNPESPEINIVNASSSSLGKNLCNFICELRAVHI